MPIHLLKNSDDLIKFLKVRRKELGLTQTELAKLCNLSLNGISKLENNKAKREVRLSTLFKLSSFLGFKLAIKVEE